jgi:membrane protein implicated in regulation of membrane protease activity
MRMFAELRVLVQTFISSMQALAWSMVFLFFSIVMGALFLSFALQDFIMDDTNAYDVRVWMYRHYGSALLSIYYFYELTMSGCWPTYFTPIVLQVSGWYSLFVIFYISVIYFAATRIITALLLKQTLQVAANDAEQQVREHRQQRQKYIQKLRVLFEAIDVNGDSMLTLEEIQCMALNTEARVVLKMLEMEVHDIEGLFHLLDTDRDGKIGFDEFIAGITRLRGQARALDMVAVLRMCDMMQVDINYIMQSLQPESLAMSLSQALLRGRMASQRQKTSQAFANGLSDTVAGGGETFACQVPKTPEETQPAHEDGEERL